MWEAEMQAELLKADSKYKAAAAAESRARKQVEKIDLFDEEGQDVEAGVSPLHAGIVEEERVQHVSVDMAPRNSKDLARRMKFL